MTFRGKIHDLRMSSPAAFVLYLIISKNTRYFDTFTIGLFFTCDCQKRALGAFLFINLCDLNPLVLRQPVIVTFSINQQILTRFTQTRCHRLSEVSSIKNLKNCKI